MGRFRTVCVGVFGLVLIVSGVMAVFQKPLRIGYHKWRLRAANIESERLRIQGPSQMEEARALLRGKPWTSLEYAHVAEQHAQALVHLGFLKRIEYHIEAHDLASVDALMAQLEEMKTKCPWWTYSVPKGATTVVVMGCPEGLAQWRKKVQKLPISLGENTVAAHKSMIANWF